MDLEFTTALVHITTCTYVLSDGKAWLVAHNYLRYLMHLYVIKKHQFLTTLAEEHWTLNDFSAMGTFLSRYVPGFQESCYSDMPSIKALEMMMISDA